MVRDGGEEETPEKKKLPISTTPDRHMSSQKLERKVTELGLGKGHRKPYVRFCRVVSIGNAMSMSLCHRQRVRALPFAIVAGV